ncbi:MAG: PEP-CTERM sorting domain-containing protein [Kiritimatiellia bacterium]|nr:PEP-CTERM sorting domain-containing protein [Kiritimatiellia bacterium]
MKKMFLTAVLMAMGSAGLHAELIQNGTLETWGALTNIPPQGAPTSWTVNGTAPTQVPGLLAGSTYAALLPANSGIGTSELTQTIPILDRVNQFDFSFVVAAADPGSTSARSFHLQMLTQTGPGTFPVPIAMIMTRGSSAGVLSLKAYNGSAWLDVAANAFNASVYNPGDNEFSTLNAYQITVSADFGSETPSYDVSYGLVGGSMTTVSNVNIFFQTPSEVNGRDLAILKFNGSASLGNYALDDISVIPEPGSIGLLAVGLFALRAIRRRRKG